VTWLDFIFALIIGASVVAGFSKGMIKIGIGMAAVLIGFLAAAWFYGTVGNWMAPVLASKAVANIIGFLAVLAVVMLVGAVVSWGLHKLFKMIGLTWLDRLVGGVFGLVRGFVISAVLLLVLLAFAPLPTRSAVVGSCISPYVMESASILSMAAPYELKAGFQKSYEEIKKIWAETVKSRKKKHEKLPEDKA
jgi:membrane protein required for colicin V production